MDDNGPQSKVDLNWSNVGLGFTFVAFDAMVSHSLGLGIGSALVTAAIRCVVQLALMALVLQNIFDAKNPYGVAGLAGTGPQNESLALADV